MAVSKSLQEYYDKMGYEIVDGQRTRACVEREATREAKRRGKRMTYYIYKLEVPGFDFVSYSYIDAESEHLEGFEEDKHYEHINTITF